MRKNKLLIAAAVAALTAGSSMAFAQGAPGHEKGNAGAQGAPAEKAAPSSAAKPGGAEHAQQQGQQKNERSTVGQGQPNEKAGQNAGELSKATESNKMGQERSKSGESNKMGQANERNKSKSETTGQAPSKSNEPAQSNQKMERSKSGADEKLKTNEKSGQREQNRSTTGQAPENRNGTMENRSGSERGGTMENRSGSERGGTTTTETRGSTSGSVNLSSEQRTRIHSIIVSDRSAPRIAHADFDLSVGTVVPRGRVKFVPLPSSIVEIEPSWRGYEFFLVGDEIVVVDPGTLRIVAVLPA